MAKKRLNKKVALIGSAVFAFLVLIIIVAILRLSQSPQKFIKDGDAAVKAADESTDEQIKEEEYKKAERCYHKARSLAKTDSLKIDMFYKLADLYIKTDQWQNVLGCWNGIIQIDPANAKAQFGRLKYLYIMADSGTRQVWKEVESQTSEFLNVADADILEKDVARLESFRLPAVELPKRLGPCLHMFRGRALLDVVIQRAVTDLDNTLAKAEDDLEKSRELEPDNPEAYLYLAQAAITKGEILAERGNFDERDKAMDKALKLLEQAVEVAEDDPRSHINLMLIKAEIARRQGREKIAALEPEYLKLVERFPSSAEAFSALARFYLLDPKQLGKATETIERAVELDKENVVYAINAANLQYRRFFIYGQKAELYKAIELAKNALMLPDARDKPGPRLGANITNKATLYSFLANCYIEQILEPCEQRTESEKQKWLTDAEQAVREIEQIFGSGEEPRVIKWRGMLELAKGNKDVAIKKLYAAYEQFEASKRTDPQLSYTLAKLFENTVELGAAAEFYVSAFSLADRAVPNKIDETRPESLLDYADLLLRLRAYNMALNVVTFFESEYWPNERSRQLRVSALISAKQFDKAEEELAKMAPDDPNTIKLNIELLQAKIEQVQRAIAQKQMAKSVDVILERSGGEKKDAGSEAADELMAADLRSYENALAGLVGKLLPIEPNFVEETSVAIVCNNYIAEGKIGPASDLVEQFLRYFPDNTAVLFYKKVLSEPEPDKISQQRREGIEQQVRSDITDPIRRSASLGVFYRMNNEPNKATEEFKKVFQIEPSRDTVAAKQVLAKTEEVADLQRLAASYLFDMAVGAKDWESAGQIVEATRRENLDGCGGIFFAARLASAKGEYKDALAKLNECLGQKPVFSYGYILRSSVENGLGNEQASIEDAHKAASLNPLDGDIAKMLAHTLYQRNQRLGSNVSSSQAVEARNALDMAMALNPDDLQLLSFYAEYISSTESLKALAIRQRLQKINPSVENALLLGRMAMRMALKETDVRRKEFLLGTAASSFEQARSLEPKNEAALEAQAEYYRLIGQGNKAEELLTKSEDPKLLWRHYFQNGQFEQARQILEQLYRADSNDINIVKGLLLVAESTADEKGVKKYSEELLSLEDSVENSLFQIQTFLKIGLIKEAEHKLQSFNERHPREPRALLLEAWLAAKQGQLEKALELTNQSLAADQDNSMAWRIKGEINRLTANYDEAIIDLKKSKSLSDEPVTRIALAKAYMGAGREEDAVTELRNTIDNPQASMEAREMLEQIYQRSGRREELRRFYSQTLEKLPDSVFWHSKAGAFAVAGGRFDEAEQLYTLAWQKSQESGKADAAAFDGYLQSLLLGGKLDKVIEEAGKYVNSDLAPIAFIRMAEAKLKLGDKASGRDYCRKAIDKAGTNENFVSEILQRMRSLLEAKEVLQICKDKLDSEPDSLAANLIMFNLMELNDEYNKAVGYIDRCLEIASPDSPDRTGYTMKKAVVLQLAYARTSDNNYLKRAIAEYESLLAKVPNNTGVLNNLAYMLAENDERLADAIEYTKRAYQARPNSPEILDTYSYVLYRNGEYSQAAAFLRSALQQYELQRIVIPPDVYEHLGQICEKLGSEDEALAAYKQALETGADRLSKTANERITSAIERLSRQKETGTERVEP